MESAASWGDGGVAGGGPGSAGRAGRGVHTPAPRELTPSLRDAPSAEPGPPRLAPGAPFVSACKPSRSGTPPPARRSCRKPHAAAPRGAGLGCGVPLPCSSRSLYYGDVCVSWRGHTNLLPIDRKGVRTPRNGTDLFKFSYRSFMRCGARGESGCRASGRGAKVAGGACALFPSRGTPSLWHRRPPSVT